MEVQGRVELSVPAASEAGWQSVGFIATRFLEGVSTDHVSFEAVSGEASGQARQARPRADCPERQL